ncbi:MAG TPA: ATP-binding protein, partial [Phycisphaerales bacterium]|nr:ATP-binding protein [Phycisphaerales bacterium]
FGYTAEEAVGQPITMLIPDERLEEEPRIIERLRRGERIDHFETVRRRRDGTLLDISLTVSPVRDGEGRIVGASKIARDITARRRLDAEVRRLLEAERAARVESERMGVLKDEFLATLSHELRTPLSAILGWCQLIRRGGGNAATAAEGLEVIERNARVQSRLIDDLLDMSRIISGKIRLDVQPVDVQDVVRTAVMSVQHAADAKGVRLEVVLDPLAGPVRGDPARLQQCFWNILSNAIKFTPRGGKVQVSLECINSHLEFTVADTGAGIRPEFLPYVFDRFRQADSTTTRRHGGLGLGLAIVKHLTELHGGKVRAKSPGEGKGTTVSMELPVMVVHADPGHHAAQQGAQASAEGELSLRGIRVLVVDDEPDGREVVRRVLVEFGAEVELAGSAEEALSAVARRPPDVLISDIGMPDHDGYELMRRIRALPAAQGGRTPAAALTAFARSEDRTRAMLAGFQTHITKPVEPLELAAAVASLANKV